MRRFFLALIAMLIAALAILLLLPSPIDPLPYRPVPGAPLAGAFAPNTSLADAKLLGKGTLNIPEDVAFDSQGRLYTATGDGRVLRVSQTADETRLETIAEVGGHPLGLAIGPDDTLYVANHGVGLQAVTLDGTVTLLTNSYDGDPILFADDLAVSSKGIVYFSDASSRFNNTTLETGPPYLPFDLLEARPHGALYAYDLASGDTSLLVEDMYFANGVALTPDESAVLVVETPRYRIRRLHLSGPKAGEADILIDDLPGLADGIAVDEEGRLYVSMQTTRSGFIDNIVHPRAWLKAIIAKLPQAIWVRPSRYGLVVIYDLDSGAPLASLHDPSGETVFSVANAVPHRGALYLGTLSNDAIAVVDNPLAQ